MGWVGQVHIWQLGLHCRLCRPRSNLRWGEKSFLNVFTDYHPSSQDCVMTWMFAGVQRKAFQQTTFVLSSPRVAPSDIHFARFLEKSDVIFLFFNIVLMLIQGTCNSMGRVNGTCDRFGCTCSERLTNVFFLNNSGWTLCFSGTLIRSDQFGELVLIWRSSTIGSHTRTRILSP